MKKKRKTINLQVCIIMCIHEKSKIPFSYMLYAYSVKEPIGELNLKRALDEDTGVFSSFFFSTGSDSRFWEFHPSSLIFVFFFILIFCESFMYYYTSTI